MLLMDMRVDVSFYHTFSILKFRVVIGFYIDR